MPVRMKVKDYSGVLYDGEGGYGKYYAALRSKLTADKVKSFAALQKPEEQIKFLLGLQGIEPQLDAEFKPLYNKEKALQFKEEGNDFYRQRQYRDAFSSYTKAIQHCPVNEENLTDPSNRDYSIIWANRSAALDGAGLYAAAMHDIDTALKYGYPRELWYKLYKRKGHCAIKMKQYLVAREALEIALKNVGRSDIKKEKDRDNYRMKIRKQMTVFNVTKSLYNVELYEYLPSTLANGEKQDRGLSKKLKISEDGGKKALLVEDDIKAEDVVIAVDPYVTVVNESGGRAGGKICPHTMEKMFHPVACSFGSEATFGTAKAREGANKAYHQYEYKILHNISEAKLLERARLALRMVTSIPPQDLVKVSAAIKHKLAGLEPTDPIYTAAASFLLSAHEKTADSEEEQLTAAVLAFYLTRNLQMSGYIQSPSKAKTSLNAEETEVYQMLLKAILISLHHARPIRLMEVPKEKKELFDKEPKSDICGYGIYPDLHQLEQAGTGTERHVIKWFVEKKMVFSCFRNLDKGQRLCIRLDTDNDDTVDINNLNLTEDKDKEATRPNHDMITFRCANELCPNSFPLKENTKEKIISCPLDECGLKTNIWERLKLIQKLKKDFAEAKEEFKKGDVVFAKDILRDTIDEWDRIIIRPYKEVDQLQRLFIKCMICEVGDRERQMIEGNQMGHIMSTKKVNVMPTEEERKKEEEAAAAAAALSGDKQALVAKS